MDLREVLQHAVIPGDEAVFEKNFPWYQCVYDICLSLNPKKVVEFGVRAGYSTISIIIACPNCHVIGIDGDIDEVTKGYYRNAIDFMPDSFDFYLLNTQDLIWCEQADLYLIDADHSIQGCLHELTVASNCTQKILVDDYAPEPGTECIRQAVKMFLLINPEWKMQLLKYDEKEVAFLYV